MLHNEKNHNNFYTKMLVAKYFGIYTKESSGTTKNRIYFGPNDMNNEKFCAKDHNKDFTFSSLDRHTNLDEKNGIQKITSTVGFG